MTRLFSPITIRDLTVQNRAWIPPMCQYTCEGRDGIVSDWHLVHYGAFAQGGFGLIIAEATGISPEGRISPYDAGIWNDEQVSAWKRVTDFVHTQGAVMGIQLEHAGRKASDDREWQDSTHRVLSPEEGGWPVVGPSPISFPGFDNTPRELTEDDIFGIITDFREAATRARTAGFDVVEIHGAHGYLLHQFYSPLSNQRTDRWGGDFDGRVRLTREVSRAIRAVWDGPLFVRISATDWTDGGWTLEESVRLARLLKDDGVDLIDVSTGGNVRADIPTGPGYQVRFAAEVRAQAEIPTTAVGLITEPAHAERLLAEGAADAIMLGRVALREPHWPQRAAHELGLRNDEAPYHPAHFRGAWPAIR